MHPAPSIIVFTTLSGLGFGMMAWLGLGAAKGEGWVAATFALLALGLAGAGLLASLFHLGRPERFLKAFSQWRSSWLSREAVLAAAAMGLFALYAGLWAAAGLRLAPLGWAVALAAVATVVATAMIYAQLRTVPRWNTPLTPVVFVLAALGGGGLLAGADEAAAVLLALLALVQIVDWRRGDRRFAAAGSTLATATGLGELGRLRSFAPPHTGQNYLLREMVHVVGRRHARRLRAAGLVLATGVPVALVALLPFGHAAAGVAVASHLAGMLCLRWLFFAEAEHVVGLYYGRR